MHIQSFKIRNFKGIKSTTIELPKPGPNSVVSLIGLNESGKTTILEAISNFLSGDESVSVLFAKDANALQVESDGSAEEAVYDYVPKAKKANFNDVIQITAKVVLNDADVESICRELFQKSSATVRRDTFSRTIDISRTYRFKDSKFIQYQHIWNIEFDATVGTQRKARSITKPSNESLWLEAITIVSERLPKIVYFPTFLFDFPERIYLVEHANETDSNRLYRRVLQDILDSEGSNLDLIKHVVERIRPKENTSVSWPVLFAQFSKRDERKQVDAVLNKMTAHMGRIVFGSWNQIFDKQYKNKRIEARIDIDDAKEDLPYIEFSIIDGYTSYLLSERSLGFRWFFSFLLFTQFRAARRGNNAAIFLFDEPASNLHAKAQIQLLKGFSNITGDRASVVYSTHSLYLIEPRYLENAYIVENRALNIDTDDPDAEFMERETDIRATKYRTFVGENPDRGSYFQPVIDHLQAIHAPVVMPDDAVIVEGKTDFYVFDFYKRKYGAGNLSFFPGAGASSSDVLVSMALGFGRNFLVLTDDDSEGRAAKQRYGERYVIGERAVTFGDLDGKYAGYKLEDLLSADTKSDIKKFFGTTKLVKKHTALFFQEMSATEAYELDEETKSAIGDIIKLITSRLNPNG